jgi:hypothetical protein
LLPASCVGHDEPSLSFYSNVPGSGGNISWNGTLPEDASPTQNQSDLYAAAWFGLVVADPSSWLGQCYVEIQLYPDFNWSNPGTSTNGEWSGAAVGWQIDPTTGTVDTCYYSPLYLHGVSSDGYFEMAQGDSFQLRLLGWAGNPHGERAWLNDSTSGAASQVTLFNATGNFPLDPAYSANDVQNALLWTTGGELPASFAFEIGRGGNPGGVTNSSFGGCSPGAKASSPVDPSVPCPSYNPLSWVNDTLTPWTVRVPSFPARGGGTGAVQFGVSSTVGGAAAIPTLSNGTCGNRIGSTDCTYPWFSYSCSAPGFTFGATDFASTSNDFGEWDQYPTTPAISLVGISAYPVNNVTLPACGSATNSVTVSTSGSPGGSVSFLGGDYTSTSSVSGIPVGNYSIQALPVASGAFAGWSISGGVGVASLTCPSTTVSIQGNGAITAIFAPSTIPSRVWFNSTVPGGEVIVTPSAYYSSPPPPVTVLSGNSLALDPGVYGIQAGPPTGNSFVSWSTTSGATDIATASPTSAVTWLTVYGATATAGLEATYVAAPGSTAVNVTNNGTGTVTLDGVTVPYNTVTGLSSEIVDVAPGTYQVSANPSPGWEFLGWEYGPSAVLVEFNATTNVSFSPGVASITATFAADVISDNAPGSGGRVAVNNVGPLADGTSSWLPRGTYDLDALPFGGEAFVHWTTSNSSALVVASPASPITQLTVNSNATVTASFAPAGLTNVTFVNSPSLGGLIRFNFQNITGPSTSNTSVADGTYLLRAVPGGTWTFADWTFTTNLSLVAGNLVVRGSGTVTAHFSHSTYGVSFVNEQSSIVLQASIGGHVLSSGDTIDLAPGKYALIGLPGADTTFLKWVTTGAMFVGSPVKRTTNLTVNGGGTLSAIADGFTLSGVTATPPGTEVGVAVSFQADLEGVSPLTYAWSGLPAGCHTSNTNPLECTPSASGASSVVVTVAGANGLPVRSSPLAFDVNGTLAVSGLSVSQDILDLGMSVTLTTGVTGGVGPYTYAYSTLPSGCTSANASVLHCTPTATGSWIPGVNVTDSLGTRAAGVVGLAVYPALVVSGLTASLTELTATVPFTITTSSAGGAPTVSYTYSGLPAGCTSADSATISCTPSIVGSGVFPIGVTVRDGAGATGSATVAVTVNPLPAISAFTATPSQAFLGTNITFKVNATGGTGPLSYAYSILPTGCSSSNVSTFTCAPVAVGTFDISVTVTDVFGKSATTGVVLTIAPIVGGEASGGSPSSIPWWVWLVIVVVVIAVVVGLLVWWRSRPPAAPPPQLNPPAPASGAPVPTAWDEGSG